MFVAKKSVKIQNISVLAKLVRKKMSNYQDQWTRYHDKPTDGINPSSNNGAIYTAYAVKLGLPVNETLLYECFKDCVKQRSDGQLYTIRSPDKLTPPQSRDEILGMAALGFLQPCHLDGWSFSPYSIPKFSVVELIKQVIELKGQHRNYFWKNNLDQIYRFAFSVPIQDRAFILECWGETKSLRYLFYKGVALLDSKFGTPKNGIPWLKYGGDERKKIMQKEFSEDHPLQNM